MSLPSIDAFTSGYFLSACTAAFDEEAHEAELHAVLLLEAVLVPVAQVDDRLHVHFVERREDRGGRLRLHEALATRCAQARHRHALLGTIERALGRGRLARRAAGGWRDLQASAGPASDRADAAIALGDAAAAAGVPSTDVAASTPARPGIIARGRKRGDVAAARRLAAGAGPLPSPSARLGGGADRFARSSVSMIAITSFAVTVEPSA